MKNFLLSLIIFTNLFFCEIAISQKDNGNSDVLQSQLILHLPFNGNALDASGYNNHASVVNATLTQDRFGIQNSAYRFNGVNNYIEIPNSYSLSSMYQGGITLASWIYIDQWFDGDFAPIMAKSINSSWGMFGIQLLNFSDRKQIEVRLNGTLANHDYTFFTNQWYFVVFTWDRSVCRYYVNGILRGQQNFSGNFPINNMPLRIGVDTPAWTEYLNGRLDDMRIYNYAISANMVNTLYNLTPSSVSPISEEVPSSYSLHQNFPNPFNPTTKIRFDIQKQGIVTLKVYDVLGKEVATLANETLQPGTYESNFDARLYGQATGLTSGVYFYRLEAEGFTDVKRFMLLK